MFKKLFRYIGLKKVQRRQRRKWTDTLDHVRKFTNANLHRLTKDEVHQLHMHTDPRDLKHILDINNGYLNRKYKIEQHKRGK